MKTSFEMVREFQTAMSQPVADKPTMMDRGDKTDQLALRMAAKRMERTKDDMRVTNHGGRVMFRGSLILEELEEFLLANTLVDQVDALTDIMYLVLGTAVEIGVDIGPCFEIVHAANMAKLGPNGQPIIDANGKVRKPTNWVPPEQKLAAEIERQSR